MASKRRFDKLNGRFFALPHELLDSAAYADLSGAAVKLLIALGRRHNGRNNGEISFSVREAATVLKSGKDKAYKTFWELWKHGFIIYSSKGTFTRR